MQGAITNLYAGVPVSDLDASIDWYTRLFGRPPDMHAGDEILSDLNEHAPVAVAHVAAHELGAAAYAIRAASAASPERDDAGRLECHGSAPNFPRRSENSCSTTSG